MWKSPGKSPENEADISSKQWRIIGQGRLVPLRCSEKNLPIPKVPDSKALPLSLAVAGNWDFRAGKFNFMFSRNLLPLFPSLSPYLSLSWQRSRVFLDDFRQSKFPPTSKTYMYSRRLMMANLVWVVLIPGVSSFMPPPKTKNFQDSKRFSDLQNKEIQLSALVFLVFSVGKRNFSWNYDETAGAVV